LLRDLDLLLEFLDLQKKIKQLLSTELSYAVCCKLPSR
jgi:hypothetical protein